MRTSRELADARDLSHNALTLLPSAAFAGLSLVTSLSVSDSLAPVLLLFPLCHVSIMTPFQPTHLVTSLSVSDSLSPVPSCYFLSCQYHDPLPTHPPCHISVSIFTATVLCRTYPLHFVSFQEIHFSNLAGNPIQSLSNASFSGLSAMQQL